VSLTTGGYRVEPLLVRDLEGWHMAKVLIAEDDLFMADMLEEVLVGAGFQVCGIARTVEEGVALGKRHKPDLALLDLRLAAGGLGPEIAGRLDRKAWASSMRQAIPVKPI
jgi:DNA-binding response OmpR family regulator